MPGHVFIVPGDIRRLACDAWLIPCSRQGTPARFKPDHWGDDFRWQSPQEEDWWSRERRVLPLRNTPPGEPAAWLVNVVAPRGLTHGEQDEFYRTMTRQALRAVLPTLEGISIRNGRTRPLVAMPFLGSGLGMVRMVERGRLLRLLLSVIHEELAATAHDVDVALVMFGSRPLAAAQHARLTLNRGWPGLSDALREQATRLAAVAASGNLALFLGAGVGIGAGLPTWESLLEAIARQNGIQGDELRYVLDKGRDILDRASFLEMLLPSGPDQLRQAVARLLGQHPHYSLSHGLLAGLPVREAITTNYDELFEEAWYASAAEPIPGGGSIVETRTSVIPHDWEPDHQRWLLKLHGCVTKPDSIVLTRESYLRFGHEWAALEGLLQATLLTRHILFIGFSLRDPNFIRILDTVRRIVRQDGAKALRGRAFGTALMIGDDPMSQRLYQNDLQWVGLGDGAEGGRRLELFLDCLLAQTRTPGHLLDEDFDSVLTDEERRLRQVLLQVAGALPVSVRSPEWERVARLLRGFGWRGQ